MIEKDVILLGFIAFILFLILVELKHHSKLMEKEE